MTERSRLLGWFCKVSSIVLIAAAPSTALADPAPGIRAVVRSANDVSIGSDAGTRIVAIPFREGATFRKDDVLVAFDCARTRAELKSAEAEWRGHQITFQNQLGLQKLHAAGNNDVLLAKAQMDKAAAAVEGWTAKVAQCEIRAPFDGRIADIFAHVFELPNPANPIVRIVDPDHLEVDMILPSNSVTRLKVGDPFTLSIEEIGGSVSGRVARIGAAVDPVSQTLKVIGVIDRGGTAVLPGMSGRAEFGAVF